MKIILNLLNNIFSAIYAQISGTQPHWIYESDKRLIIISDNCKMQIIELGLSESYATDVYTNGMKRSKDYMVKKYHGYEVTIRYWIKPNSGQVYITWIGKEEVR